MSDPFQTGIIAEASSDALFITLNADHERLSDIKSALASYPAIVKQLQEEYPEAELHAAFGISHLIWDKLDDQRPLHLAPFPSYQGPDANIVATDVDLVWHIRSQRKDITYMLAQQLFDAFAGSLTVVEEVSCFKYLDNRDLTGFVDGTENPTGDAKKDVALVDEEDIAFKHGSYFNLMRFVHDLGKWQQQDLQSQEDTYGRTKQDNIEYPGDKKSLHAHTKRTSLKDAEGRSIEILRHSMPFASLAEKGLMFASYSKTPHAFNLMLESMVVGDEDGHTDHLMKYTTATTGQAFFVPANTWFENLSQ
ncbi:Dyp-type peroxidase [Marinomonas dokdonensis]|uniref:Dyp-type peroxidase n=1 Tax=Marinomonas dokdonensis TaxID=328224 RepID=UPI0040557E95